MNNRKLDRFEALKNPTVTLLLFLLLSADLVHILLHVVNSLSTSVDNRMLNLTLDVSYAEWYQYIKFFFLTILLIKLAFPKEPFRFLIWAGIFAYMLFDDSLEIHGKVGGYIAINMLEGITPPFGLRLEDLGSLIISALVGLVIIVALGIAYWKGSRRFRLITLDLILLLALMVFFGVFFDMVHVAIKGGKVLELILEIIEDGGEMITASLMLWYALLINVSGDKEISIWNSLRGKAGKNE